MKYKNAEFTHGQKKRIAVLITNLGTPAAPTKSALRRYLKQFLSDPRVVEFPRFVWWCILNFIILSIRPARSAKAYQTVWTDEGSPLAIHTEAQCKALAAKLADRFGDDVIVEWAMRYGEPSIDHKLDALMQKGVQKLFVLPLYPQYSASTSGSTFDALADNFKQRRWLPELRFLNDYHDNSEYIDAIAHSIQEHWQKHGKQEKLLFSYHGIPLRYLHNGDPYHCFCLRTTRLVAEKLDLSDDDYLTVFQSRFGREAWLQPYADHTLKSLGGDGVKSVAVVCPGFSSDCLETIEEIGVENRDYFLEAGGKEYHYIPALNATETHINALASMCIENIADWHESLNTGEEQQSLSRYNSHSFNR